MFSFLFGLLQGILDLVVNIGNGVLGVLTGGNVQI
ncbi:hypothetical protein MMUC44124_27175 [Mycolicibacterium mucogenicum DSM 44124]|nr:hypothetical protein MMUC44124_27175 [Mycolicibacterium mucogenicum DSM 44124]